MANELQIFNYGAQEVRTIQKDGEAWWVLRDACDVLQLSDTNKTAERLDHDELTRIRLVSGGQSREMLCVNEAGLYKVILRSDKPEAKLFMRWVTHEVLPSIRKHGMYATNELLDNPEFLLETVQALVNERKKSAQLAAENNVMRPKALFADAVSDSNTCILVGELAKILKGNGFDIGQNRLFERLRNEGFLIKRKGTDYNAPTQKAMELGLFRVKETVITHNDGHTTVNRTTKVTGKGQQYFVNYFMEA